MAKRKTSQEWEIKDRIYILSGGKTPVNYILRSRHHINKPLQYFDGSINETLLFDL